MSAHHGRNPHQKSLESFDFKSQPSLARAFGDARRAVRVTRAGSPPDGDDPQR
jgi:hypothetical protein